MLLNKKQFIQEVAKRCMVTTYVVEEIYNVSSGLVAEQLVIGNNVELPNMGKFEIRSMDSKNLVFSKNDVCVYPAFKVGTALKNRVKNAHRCEKKI